MQGKCNTSQNKYLEEHEANVIIKTLATLHSVFQTKVFWHFLWDSSLNVHFCRIGEA
jgi:hypothetical protein